MALLKKLNAAYLWLDRRFPGEWEVVICCRYCRSPFYNEFVPTEYLRVNKCPSCRTASFNGKVFTRAIGRHYKGRLGEYRGTELWEVAHPQTPLPAHLHEALEATKYAQ